MYGPGNKLLCRFPFTASDVLVNKGGCGVIDLRDFENDEGDTEQAAGTSQLFSMPVRSKLLFAADHFGLAFGRDDDRFGIGAVLANGLFSVLCPDRSACTPPNGSLIIINLRRVYPGIAGFDALGSPPSPD